MPEVATRDAYEKGALKNFAKFTEKHLCQSLFFNKLAGFRHRCFPVNFATLLRTGFLQNTSGQLPMLYLPSTESIRYITFIPNHDRFKKNTRVFDNLFWQRYWLDSCSLCKLNHRRIYFDFTTVFFLVQFFAWKFKEGLQSKANYISEGNLEPSRTSALEHFCEDGSRLLAVSYFHE